MERAIAKVSGRRAHGASSPPLDGWMDGWGKRGIEYTVESMSHLESFLDWVGCDKQKQHKLKQAAKTPRGPKQKTPYTGVFYHVRSRKYDAAAWNRESKRQEYLGSFCNPEEAAVARDLFMIHLYSEINSAKV